MSNDTSPSLTKTIESRYATQRCGGAFDVKERLKNPGVSIVHRDLMPIDGIDEKRWTVPHFDTKPIIQETELLDVMNGNYSKELSVYMRGFSNKKYHR